jgi:hypothetical protein
LEGTVFVESAVLHHQWYVIDPMLRRHRQVTGLLIVDNDHSSQPFVDLLTGLLQ